MKLAIGTVYSVFSRNGCVVSFSDGTECLSVPAEEVRLLLAQEEEMEVSDPAAIVSIVPNGAEVLHGVMMSSYSSDKLPDGYRRVEFLKSTGTQYINTGFSPDADTGCHIETEPSQFINFTLLAGAASENNSFVPLQSYSNNTIGFSSKGVAVYPLQDGSDAANGNAALSGGYKAFGRITVDFNYKNSGIWNYSDSLNKVSRSVSLRAFGLNIYLFARNYNNNQPGGNYFYGWGSPIYSARFTKGPNLIADFIPALAPNGEPCMVDLVSKQPFTNDGTGQFIAGFTMAQARKLGKLPAGTTLTISLPVGYDSDAGVVAALSAAEANGCVLTVQTYEAAGVAAATFALRRVWVRGQQDYRGSYVDADGSRWHVDWCVDIIGADPESLGYERFRSVDAATEYWGLVPYEYPEEELSTEA